MPEYADAVPRRSAFAASFLSLLFPGLGQAYGGAPRRGLAFAAPAILLTALAAGIWASPDARSSLTYSLLNTNVLIVLLVADIVLLAYRIVAIVDAYRVTAILDTWRRAASLSVGQPRLRVNPLSVVGLLAVLAVASGAHVAVAYYDLTAYDLIRTITSEGEDRGALTSPSTLPSPIGTPATASTGSPEASPAATPEAPDDRVNILLVGVDQRPEEETFNTDTMIVVSIDPHSRQVAMFSLPRDMVDIPLPRDWPAYDFYGGSYPGKINSLWSAARGAPSRFPFPNGKRGPEALKGVLGNLYGMRIPYYVMVNFDGFRRVVDTLGGVNVRVDLPVEDDKYPQGFGRGQTRLYIPATIQHMTGDQALAYARSRHGSNDFDRAQRQQNVLFALRQQADIPTLLANLQVLVAELKDAVRTDIPTSELPRLAALAEEVGLEHPRSVVFAPPLYGREVFPDPRGRGYVIEPKVGAIRQAVRQVFAFDPELEASRELVAAEGARVRVLNGSGISGQAAAIRDYLEFRGFDASVPSAGGGRAEPQTYTTTVVTVYNGAEARLTESIAVLEEVFRVRVVLATDATVKVDIIVITGRDTPDLSVP